MIKILHCADIHLGDLSGPVRDGKNARREDTIRCMRAITDAAKEEQPQVSIIAGDLFNRSRVWADTALDDISAALTSLISPICTNSEYVVLLFGTQNHDNPKAFQTIRRLLPTLHNLKIYTSPMIETLDTSQGRVQILAMPGFDKGRLRAFMPDADAEAENLNATSLINETVMGLAAKAYTSSADARILTAHYTVAGCEGENGEIFLAGQDAVLLPQTIDSAGLTLACLGHIHKPQRLSCTTPAYYSGSPNQLTFNDEGIQHGFLIHEITGDNVKTRFLKTPERRHFTFRMPNDAVAAFLTNGRLPAVPEEAKDAIVRVIYRAAPEQEKQLNKAALQAELLANGAFYIADIHREEADDAILTAADAEGNPSELLHRYLKTAQETQKDITDETIIRLEERAKPILTAADDGRETGKHSGAFTPMRIEVTNYRSYAHAEFDFTDIRMAMVNGANGVGKSSLFMDALADCLFEQSREGSVGEWLRAGEKKGSILFTFEMGGHTYRVGRTRTASGKGTLSISRGTAAGEWTSMTAATMKQTQEIINQVIGMDCQTFCSIALIRQDAYGVFLDAGAEKRMEVLASLLNLGIYGRAEDLAKEKTSEQRREIARINGCMESLETSIDRANALKQKLAEAQEKRDGLKEQSRRVEDNIRAIQDLETLRQEKVQQAQEKAQEAANLDAQAAEKEAEAAKKRAEMEEAAKLAAMAGKAADAAETIKTARKQLETLAQDEADLIAKTEKRNALTDTVIRLEGELKRITQERTRYEEITAQQKEIEKAAAEIEAIRKAREKLAPRIEIYRGAAEMVTSLRQGIADFLAESRIRIGSLKSQVEAAEKKAALLISSGCPVPDNASCEFLRDAKDAKDALEGLRAKLEETKAQDRQTYAEMTEKTDIALARLEELGDPMTESAELDKKERKAAPMAALAGKLEAAQNAAVKFQEEAQEKDLAIINAEKERDAVCDAIASLRQSAEEAARLRKIIREAEPIAAMQSRCAAAEATVTALKATIDIITEDAKKRRAEAVISRQKAEEMSASIRGSDPMQEALKHLPEKKKILQGEIEEITRSIGSLQATLEQINADRRQWEDCRDQKAEAARALSDYQTLADAFGLDGIQYAIIRSTVPEIESRANMILSAMTGGRMAVEFRTERENSAKKIVNTLDVWISSQNGISRPYASHSGGEKVKIALAVTLGLADVKARRAGVQLGMLWIDEPPFLDSEGTEAYADALAEMAQRNPGMRILAISHDPQLKARFPQNITVTAGDNGSAVTRA